MKGEYQGRYCTIFYCDKVRECRCCADCPKPCSHACQNDPSRCGLEDTALAKGERRKKPC